MGFEIKIAQTRDFNSTINVKLCYFKYFFPAKLLRLAKLVLMTLDHTNVTT